MVYRPLRSMRRASQQYIPYQAPISTMQGLQILSEGDSTLGKFVTVTVTSPPLILSETGRSWRLISQADLALKFLTDRT